MKTIEQTARECARKSQSLVMNSTEEDELYEDDLIRMFLAGDEFGYRRGVIESFQWLSINEGNPEKYDFVIMKDEREPIHAKGYFIVSGEHAKKWGFPYIKGGYTHWRPIEPVKE